MLKHILFTFLATSLFFISQAQNARIQFIHNCPDAIADTIDVYLNGQIWFNDVAFRNSTTFVNITSDIEAQIDIAPKTSADVSESIYNFVFTPLLNEKYLLIANGLLSESGYLPNTPFSLNLFAGARELSGDGTGTDILLHHGCTDLSSFDLVESNLLQINAFDDVAYGEFRGYESILTAAYTFSVQDTQNNYNIGIFDAPLAALGLGNDAVTILTSGFINPLNNQNGPSFGLYLSLATGGPFVPLGIPKASVQIIHNSPDEATSEIDLYLNGQLLVDNFQFRTATPFIDVSASSEIILEAAPSGSTGPEDAIAGFPLTLIENGKYIIAIQGIISTTDYDPAPSLGLKVMEGAQTMASTPENSDILIIHGSTDAGEINITDYTTSAVISGGLSYNEHQGYQPFQAADYIWTVSGSDNNSEVAHYTIPLQTEMLAGEAITLLASGFLNPAINNGGPEFGLWYTTSQGGDLIALPVFVEEPLFARTQMIHNSADAALQSIDVYVNGTLHSDNLNFRDATSFFTIQVNDPIEISIAPANSTSVSDALATFTRELNAGESYVMILSGILSDDGYNPVPALDFDIYEGARETAVMPAETAILVYHGSADSPAIDIDEAIFPIAEVVDNLSYGEFEPYISLNSSGDYVVKIRNNDGNIVLAEYQLPLSGLNLGGAAVTAFAGGFLNPVNNSDGPLFHVWIALADGTTLPLPIYVGVPLVQSNSSIKLYPNPATEKIILSGELNRTSPVYYHVLNAQGHLIDSGIIQSSNASSLLQLSLRDYASGMYVLEINNGQLSERVSFSVIK